MPLRAACLQFRYFNFEKEVWRRQFKKNEETRISH